MTTWDKILDIIKLNSGVVWKKLNQAMNINIFLGIVRLEPWNSSDRGVFLITSTHEVYVLKLGFEF